MKFEPGENHTYKQLDPDELESAWSDACGELPHGAPVLWEHKYRFDGPPKENPSVREWQLNRYGLTSSEYEHIKRSQDGKCAICEQKCSSGRRLAVDHDHETGDVRGLLCTRCNLGLGLFKDNVSTIQVAIRYLNRSKTRPYPV